MIVPDRLTQNISFSELDRQGFITSVLMNMEAVAHLLQASRDCCSSYFGRDVPHRITSGFRESQFNASIGGDKESRHLTGAAADFVPIGITLYDYVKNIKESTIEFSNMIVYPFSKGHVHIQLPETRGRQLIRVHNPVTNKYDSLTQALLARFPGAPRND